MNFVILLVALMANFVFAESIRSKVYEILVSNKKGFPHLIKMENGRVVFLRFGDKKTLKLFQRSAGWNETLSVEVDEKGNFEASKTTSPSVDHEVIHQKRHFSFDPHVVTSDQANSIFSRMRKSHQSDSQCYNRAHIWAYEEFQKTNLNSMKLFLFFTNLYIRNYRYKWWFHVAPMVYQVTDNVYSMTVLDRTFTNSPRTVSSWLKTFIFSGRNCQIVNRYSDYRNHQEKEDCYLIPVSMYFWQPRDIERQELTGYVKTSFLPSEVNHAYWEAF